MERLSRSRLRPAKDVLYWQLDDPATRQHWERTALARAVALWLTRYRAEHGLSQTAVARRLGMSQPAVARLEAGEHVPTIATLIRLADRLGMQLRLEILPREEAGNQKGSEASSGTQSQVTEEITTERGTQLLVTTSFYSSGRDSTRLTARGSAPHRATRSG